MLSSKKINAEIPFTPSYMESCPFMDFIHIDSDGRCRSKVLTLCLLAANFVILLTTFSSRFHPECQVDPNLHRYTTLSTNLKIIWVQQAEWLSIGLAPITQYSPVRDKNNNTQGSAPNVVKFNFHTLRNCS